MADCRRTLPRTANANHIAALHPGVALALADLLIWHAKASEFSEYVGPRHPASILARAYLGEQS